jgi:hypothetical protein
VLSWGVRAGPVVKARQCHSCQEPFCEIQIKVPDTFFFSDWFFKGLGDKLNGVEGGEQVN